MITEPELYNLYHNERFCESLDWKDDQYLRSGVKVSNSNWKKTNSENIIINLTIYSEKS